MQHGMEEMKPLLGGRLGHPPALALHGLDGMLFHVRQHDGQCVRSRGSGTLVIRAVAPARTGVAIAGAVVPIGHPGVREMGQSRREFWRGQPRHRP